MILYYIIQYRVRALAGEKKRRRREKKYSRLMCRGRVAECVSRVRVRTIYYVYHTRTYIIMQPPTAVRAAATSCAKRALVRAHKLTRRPLSPGYCYVHIPRGTYGHIRRHTLARTRRTTLRRAKRVAGARVRTVRRTLRWPETRLRACTSGPRETETCNCSARVRRGTYLRPCRRRDRTVGVRH